MARLSLRLRRALFGATACTAFALVLGPIPSKAGDQDVSQAEWPQSYEASPQMTVAREATPILSPATVDATQAAIQKYQDLVSRGGWSSVPAGPELRVGSKSKAVHAVAPKSARRKRRETVLPRINRKSPRRTALVRVPPPGQRAGRMLRPRKALGASTPNIGPTRAFLWPFP